MKNQVEIQQQFKALDKNGDGKLSKEELINGYEKFFGDKESAIIHVNKIMEYADFDRSGLIDYTEFMVCANTHDTILNKKIVEQAFGIIDQDGNGYITKDELQETLGDLFTEETWTIIIERCDKNKDGKISLEEFIDLLTKGLDSFTINKEQKIDINRAKSM